MTAGLQLLNVNGGIQLDGTSYSYGLSIHQQLTTVSGGISYNINYGYQNCITFGFNASAPILAISSTSGVPVVFNGLGKNTSTASGNWMAQFMSESPCTFDIYIFDLGPTCSPSNTHAGLQIWDANGTLLTDGALGFLNLLGIQGNNITDPGRGQWTTASYGISQVATIVQVGSAGHSVIGTTGAGYDCFAGWSHSGGSAILTNAQLQTAAGNTNQYSSRGMTQTYWQAAHIDVSNLGYVNNAGGDGGIVPISWTANTGSQVMW